MIETVNLEKPRYYIFIDPDYKVVISVVKMRGPKNFNIELSQESYLTEKTCEVIEMEQIPEFMEPSKDQFYQYCYFNGVFLKRPHFEVQVWDPNFRNIQDPENLRAGEAYVVRVHLKNPAKVKWGDVIKEVKVKDLSGFFPEYSKSVIFKFNESGFFDFSIVPQETGAAEFHIYDVKKLALREVLRMNFK